MMLITDELLLGLSLIFILGVVGYLLAWYVRLPTLVVLFLGGIVAGPYSGLVDPDALLGPVLFPAISLVLGLILFQGGLTLRLSELPAIGGLTLRLIVIAAPLMAGAAAALAYFVLELDLALSILVGSLLALPAPTVVGPLLERVRPRAQMGSALKWEAIVVNPLGAAVAILLFEAVLAGDLSQATGAIFYGAARALVIGSGMGIVAGVALWWLLDGERVSDPLRNSVVVLVLVVALLIANWLQPDAGLLALAVAGVVFANQDRVEIGPVVGFLDGLHVLMVGPLLFVLAARLDPSLFTTPSVVALLLFTALLLVARPLALFVAGWGSALGKGEKLFLGWSAARGVVPVALGTVFALELGAVGHAGAERLAFITVMVALFTAGAVWLAAGPLARRFQVATSADGAESAPVASEVILGERESRGGFLR